MKYYYSAHRLVVVLTVLFIMGAVVIGWYISTQTNHTKEQERMERNKARIENAVQVENENKNLI